MPGLRDRLLARVETDLNDIEDSLKDNLKPHLELVSNAAGHLMFSGGKRLRPLLNILSARICGYEDEFIVRFSTIIEFLHTATLLHDDVVDGASMRRGKPAAHSIYGTPVTVLVGDFLLARALSIAAQTENPKIISVISGITEIMCQGEIQQLTRKGDVTLTESEYMEVIQRKTGFLLQGACQTGAILAGADDSSEKQLTSYGYHIGLVFQIADDLLDYTADAETTGKNPGADLQEGKVTLPVIHALGRAPEKDRARMVQIIKSPVFSSDEFRELREMIDFYGGISYSKQAAGVHVRMAKEIIQAFPESYTRQTLSMIADYALSRSS